jgi:hypothetical protein
MRQGSQVLQQHVALKQKSAGLKALPPNLCQLHKTLYTQCTKNQAPKIFQSVKLEVRNITTQLLL